jgi:hypothetical protein
MDDKMIVVMAALWAVTLAASWVDQWDSNMVEA